MLTALRLEPSRFFLRFFLKGKVRQKKQATYINILSERKLAKCEMNTKEEHIKSTVRDWSKDFRSRKDISIKPADKGSGVVVMNHQQYMYINEAMHQLTNRTNYETLESDPTSLFCVTLTHVIRWFASYWLTPLQVSISWIKYKTWIYPHFQHKFTQ